VHHRRRGRLISEEVSAKEKRERASAETHTVLCVVLLAAIATASSASNLVIQTTPDAFVSDLAVDFTGGQLTVTGFANTLTDNIAGQITLLPITSGSFALTANIDSNGVASGGVLTLTGFIYDELGAPLYAPSSGALLSGTLSSLSFDQTADSELDFQFSFLSGGPSAALRSGRDRENESLRLPRSIQRGFLHLGFFQRRRYR
jgi:hypothetical protein